MWIGLLTPGAHPDRPAATEHLATLFSWTPDARARVDGPMPAAAAGLRAMRAPTGADPACLPRCFTCRRTYPVPDPAVIRALDDDEIHGLDPDVGEAHGPEDEAAAGPVDRPAVPPRAIFALVHVDDDAAVGDEGEILVVVPGTYVVSLVPFDCVAEFGMILAEAYGGLEAAACDECGTVVPGGSLGAPDPGRAARRRAGDGRRRAA